MDIYEFKLTWRMQQFMGKLLLILVSGKEVSISEYEALKKEFDELTVFIESRIRARS